MNKMREKATDNTDKKANSSNLSWLLLVDFHDNTTASDFEKVKQLKV
jgi:hypothetical protein